MILTPRSRHAMAAGPVIGILAASAFASTVAASVTFRLDLLVMGLAMMAAVVALPGLLPAARRDRAAGEAWLDAGKRTIDIALAGLAIVLLLPVLAVIAIAVRLGDGGPVMYRQRRVGMNGELFSMYKFRSMRPCDDPCEPPPGIIAKDAADPRITAVGRLLRRSSLDELPQMVNILLGHMSIVGPRPLPPCEAAVVPDWAAARWQVRPGLTCYWQVGGRSEIGWEERMEMDVRYVQERSIGVDARLIARTFDAVVSGRGAY
jgi:lipopolysaccharide/colanic/teichoic acid biosynthesis glycosyltransferase